MDAMIRLEHVVKTFTGSGNEVHAVRDVSLEIPKGEIYGIVGYSGAGKSTLVRCINLLERPSSGRVIVDGVELTALGARALNRERRSIGMIFQQFNLFATRTVLENIAFPLRHSGMKREAIRKKALDLLDYVELSDKAQAYPSQLSGGQKQRVAIARALACDPKVLLCDEATSALDPQTTTSILKLLRKLNRETGITLVVITHQMQVVKEICTRMAVMEGGKIVEEGEVYSLFSNPSQPITRSFVDLAGNIGRAEELLEEDEGRIRLENGDWLLRLKFLEGSAARAIVSQVSRTYGIDMNILFGNIDMIDGKSLGGLVVIVSGQSEKVEAMIEEMKRQNVAVEVLKHA